MKKTYYEIPVVEVLLIAPDQLLYGSPGGGSEDILIDDEI